MKKRFLGIMSVILAVALLVGVTEIITDSTSTYASDTQGSNGVTVSVVPAPRYYYNFDSGIGDAVVVTKDITGKAVVPHHTLMLSEKYAEGKNGRALNLDGSYGLRIPVRNLGKSYTISFWVKVDTEMKDFSSIIFAGRNYLNDNNNVRWLSISKSDFFDLGGSPFIWSRDAINGVGGAEAPWYCYVNKNAGGKWEYKSLIKPKNGWKHVILTVDGKRKALFGSKTPDDIGDGVFVPEYYEGPAATTYVDGEFFGAGCVVADIYESDRTETYVGIDPWNDNFKGYIDDLAFYSQSVTAAEAKRIYEKNASGDGQDKSEESGDKNHNVTKVPTPTPVSDPKSEDLTQNKSSDEKDSDKDTDVETLSKVFSLKLKAKKKAFTATWKKVKNAAKYQIQYADSKKKLAKAKKKTVSKNFVAIKGLIKKKTYYVRVRAYMKKDKTTISGKWSSVKKIKIKK